ncbi:MAG: hypothetical protein AAF828_00300 [Bacteroidota bacterium]
MMTSRILSLVAVLSLLPVFNLRATSIFDLLQQSAAGTDEATSVAIKLPMDSIYAKTVNGQFATLTFTDQTGLVQRWPLQVDVRGKYRRRICTFPPIKLNFSKKELKKRGFAKHDKLKLVTPCLEDETGQKLILKEYLAYKMLNQITPASFRVQLLEVTYQDVNGNHPDQTFWAFVLEDTDEMAERIGGKELDDARGLAPQQFDRDAEITQSIFAYFIGNTDWNPAAAHNLKMIQLDNGAVVPVPYDFDFSGLVYAPYARPNSSVGQLTISQRIYLGFTATDEQLDRAVQLFTDHKKDLLRTVRQFKPLSTPERFEMIDYLNTFYFDLKILRKTTDLEPTFYDRLRGADNELFPAGSVPEYYGISKK